MKEHNCKFKNKIRDAETAETPFVKVGSRDLSNDGGNGAMAWQCWTPATWQVESGDETRWKDV